MANAFTNPPTCHAQCASCDDTPLSIVASVISVLTFVYVLAGGIVLRVHSIKEGKNELLAYQKDVIALEVEFNQLASSTTTKANILRGLIHFTVLPEDLKFLDHIDGTLHNARDYLEQLRFKIDRLMATDTEDRKTRARVLLERSAIRKLIEDLRKAISQIRTYRGRYDKICLGESDAKSM